MASITITIPDPVVSDVLDAYAAKYARPDQIIDPAWIDPEDGSPPDMIANPESKVAFAKRMIAQEIKKVYLSRRADVHRATMNAALVADEDNMVGVE